MSLGQNNASQDLEVTQVFYAGTSTLKEGQPVVYDNDDTNAPVSPTDTLITGNESAGQINFQGRKNLRGRRVIDPVSTAKGGLAGLVEASSAGVTGPAMITIVKLVKGSIVTAQAAAATYTKNVTILSVDSATPTNNLIADSSTVTTPTTTTLYDQVGVAYESRTLSAAGPLLIRVV